MNNLSRISSLSPISTIELPPTEPIDISALFEKDPMSRMRSEIPTEE